MHIFVFVDIYNYVWNYEEIFIAYFKEINSD